MLDALLDTSLSSVKAASSMMEAAKEGDLTMDSPEARVRLSNSTMGLIRSCERKFQKAKLLRTKAPREESPALSFGKGYGAGVQHYLVLRSSGVDIPEALAASQYVAWLAYFPALEDERRFQARMVDLIGKAVPFLEARLQEWEVATFNGKPASELSFCLNISERYYYVGYIDLVMRHKESGRYAIVDIKTTSLTAQDLRPYYRNSDQGIGYSIVLDAIVGKELGSFDVSYWATQLPGSKAEMFNPKHHELTFPYTIKDRFDWFLKLYLDVNYITALEQMTAYPKRGNACMSYNRVCNFYTECNEVALDEPQIYKEDDIVYDFYFELADLLANHQARLERMLIPLANED